MEFIAHYIVANWFDWSIARCVIHSITIIQQKTPPNERIWPICKPAQYKRIYLLPLASLERKATWRFSFWTKHNMFLRGTKLPACWANSYSRWSSRCIWEWQPATRVGWRCWCSLEIWKLFSYLWTKSAMFSKRYCQVCNKVSHDYYENIFESQCTRKFEAR